MIPIYKAIEEMQRLRLYTEKVTTRVTSPVPPQILDELRAYDEAIVALKKLVPLPVKKLSKNEKEYFYCSKCDRRLGAKTPDLYCPRCGQAIGWEVKR